MKKIPTLFVRDENNRKYVTEEVTPGCEWVLAGEGVATRKYDGTCLMLDGPGIWWARREVKKDQTRPEGFKMVSFDPITLKTTGWVPVEDSPFYKWFLDAMDISEDDKYKQAHAAKRNAEWYMKAGTYELCGPKINGNPEGYEKHRLIPHAGAATIERRDDAGPITFDMIKGVIVTHAKAFNQEGIVWHHPDGRMAKLKAKDFPK